MKRGKIRIVFIVGLISMFQSVQSLANVSPLDYFDMGARAYYGDDLEAAKEAVNLGLDRYPLNQELTALRDLIEREQQRQEQQQQQQEESEEQDQGDDGEQGDQGEQGQEGQEGQEGESGEEQQNGESDQNQSSSQDSSNQQGEDGESGETDGSQQSERTAEEYAEQSLDEGDDGQIGQPEEVGEGESASAMNAAEEGRPIYMTEEEAMRLLETLSGQERQLPFFNIERSDADKFSSEKRNY